MYFKIAYKNVKKSYHDFLIYFLTLAFSVCLFYTFNSFKQQTAILKINEAQKAILDMTSLLMNSLSFFVVIVFAFLILYANRFLIKRRKQEFGLYQLLGMPNHKIKYILIYETVLIGLISLVIGMILGLILSQCLGILTASLFEVELNYHFIFSWDATFMTILSFMLIFFIMIFLNGFEISRFKLIDLLHANRKQQHTHLNNIYLSVCLFITSIGLLVYAYHLASKGAYTLYLNDFQMMLGCGLVGTFLLFFSLTGFLLKFIQSNKRLYYRNLNLFVLKQLNANINSNFISMSIITILLLLSIGALSTGFSLRNSINSTIIQSTPYDASIYVYGEHADASLISYDKNLLKKPEYFNIYDGSKLKDVAKYANQPATKQLLTNSPVSESTFMHIKLSEFNAFLKHIGESPIHLEKNEGYAFSSSDMILDYLKDVMKSKPTLKIYDQDIKIKETSNQLYSGFTTTNMQMITFAIVVADEVIPEDAPIYLSALNLTIKDGSNQVINESLETNLNQVLKEHANTNHDDPNSTWYGYTATAYDVKNNTTGLSTVFTYVGLYLGIVFLIACSVILALQQLSSANSDQLRYRTLSQIGCSKKMINQAIFLQISLYFFIPLIVGVIHSFFGIQFIGDIVQVFGKMDILNSSIYTSIIFIAIYGSYFYVTYLGYRSIIHSKIR